MHSKWNQSVIENLSEGPLRIMIVGGGNWGTTVAKIVASKANSSYIFHENVYMWIKEEYIDGVTLTQIINEKHENIKYLPGIELPKNLIVVSDLLPYIKNADLILIVLPHQFVESVIHEIKGHVKTSAQAISFVKGLKTRNNKPYLFSELISETLQIPCAVLSGANVAKEVASGQFSEATLGYNQCGKEIAVLWQNLLDTPSFKINPIPDISGIEICGALKNVIALAVGFSNALGYGTNTKAALIRIGVDEMKYFANKFFDGILDQTFFDSAGYADVITTSLGGRNVRCAEEYVIRKQKDTFTQIEADLLNGQKLQGYITARDVYEIINHHNLHSMMPLFSSVYKIVYEQENPSLVVTIFQTQKLRLFGKHY